MLDSDYDQINTKLSDSRNSLNSLKEEIQNRQTKISNLESTYNSANSIITVFDDYLRPIIARSTECTQVCSQISEKLFLNNTQFDKPSRDLINKEEF